MHTSLIEYLKSFNAKERFFLLGKVLGNPTFSPSPIFLKQLGSILNLQIPETVFSAMDYHLDWLYASLQLNQELRAIYLNQSKIIKGQQQDIDFLIAFNINDFCHIVLIEAKGITPWSNEQMTSKMDRLKDIFGENGDLWDGVIPHFIFISPSKPKKLDMSKWPHWITKTNNEVYWLELAIDSRLNEVFRCDFYGKKNKNGQYWAIKKRTISRSEQP